MRNQIVEFYRELSEKISVMPISQTLPLFYRLAHELGETEVERWALLELNGYYQDNPAQTKNTRVPTYRKMAGQYRDMYSQPIPIQDARLSFLGEYLMRNGAGELEQMANHDGNLAIQDPIFVGFIQKNFGVLVHSLVFSPFAVAGIVTTIKSQLLDKFYAIRISHADMLSLPELPKSKMKDSSQQVSIKLERGATISGNLVIADLIQNSFNKADLAEIPSELKTLLKEMTSEIFRISAGLPTETSQEMARDLENLTAEIISKSPRKQWILLSFDGLKKAAKDVGEIGEPVLKLAGQIIQILMTLKLI